MNGPPPFWQKVAASVVAIALIVTLVVVTWGRLGGDFWPPDRSFIGPNIVASTLTWAFVVVVTVLIWPPTRRRLQRFIEDKVEKPFRAAHKALHDHHEQHHADIGALKEMVEELHHKVHTGEPHPRVVARENGEDSGA